MATMIGAMLGRAAHAAPCPPAAIAADASSLPDPWRRALDALVAATAREGRPWSCTGAQITLTLPRDGEPGRLVVKDASGRLRERPITTPDDVVPLGEAMLATTIPGAPPPAARPPEPETPPKPAPSTSLRLGVGVLADARYSGPVPAFWMGAALRGGLQIDAWSVGLWARYDGRVAQMDPHPDPASMSSIAVGLAGGYRFLRAPFELAATFEPSLAVTTHGGGPERDADARVDPRLGARLGAAIPFGSRFRGLVSLDGEIAPGEGGRFHHHDEHRSPPPASAAPGFLIGLSVGAELVVR